MSEASRSRFALRWAVALFAIAFGLNFVWEMAQASLYEPMGDVWQATRRCFVASVGDAALVLIVLTLTRVLAGRTFIERPYVVATVLALVVALAVEWWGLAQGRWTYRPEMPRVPGTAVGVVPLLQMAILTPITMWFADRTSRRT